MWSFVCRKTFMQMIYILEMQIANGRVRREEKSLWNMSVNNCRKITSEFSVHKKNILLHQSCMNDCIHPQG